MKEKNRRSRKPKLLMFEDDPFVTDVYKREFQEAGFEVRNFNTYEHVVEIVAKENPDIISCDIIMEPIDGWEAIKLLKKDERTKNIPLFIVDNMCQKEDVQKGLGVGASRFFCKAHYTPKQIAEFFKNYLIPTKESQKNEPSKKEKELEKIIEGQSEKEFIESIMIMLSGFRAPLTAIKGYSELLKGGEFKGKEEIAYKNISRTIKRVVDSYNVLYNLITKYYKEKIENRENEQD